MVLTNTLLFSQSKTQAFKVLGFLFYIFILNGCNPDEAEPSWLILKPWLNIVQPGEGTNSQNFPQAWVFINGKSIGVYSVPDTLPILESGKVEIISFPGIARNGIKSDAITYPMMDFKVDSILLTPGKYSTYQPISTYEPDLVKFILEDFEGATNTFTGVPGNNGAVVNSTMQVFEGGQAGMIHLDTVQKIVDLFTQDFPLNSSTNHQPVYCEIHFKGQVPLRIGVQSEDGGGGTKRTDIVVLFPTDQWTKVYVDLTSAIGNNFPMQKHRLVISSQLNSIVFPYDKPEATIYIDNIKVLHLP